MLGRMVAEVCVNCDAPVSEAGVFFDGRPYCCAGCVSHQPCRCGAAARQPHLVERPPDADVRPPTPGARVTADPAAGEREPPRFPRTGDVTVLLHAAGFVSERDALMFAAQLDQSPEFGDVSLMRMAEGEAWFSVRAAAADRVTAVLGAFRGFVVRVEPGERVVEVTVAPPAASPAPPSGTPAAAPGEDALLPPRPRFRIFRPAPEHPRLLSAGSEAEESAEAPAIEGGGPAAERPEGSLPPPAPPVPPPAATTAARLVARPPDAPASDAGEAVAGERPAEAGAGGADASAPPVIVRDEVAPEERPGGAVLTVEHLTMVVYPFRSFASLNEFQGAVRRLHGVMNTRVRRFYRGTLHLAVDYEDIIPLSERLREIRGFTFSIASETRSEIEVVLEDSAPLAATATSSDGSR